MAAEIICDGCGKREPMIHGNDGLFHKPSKWFSRSDDDGIQIACSRECIDKVAKETGKSRSILPW